MKATTKIQAERVAAAGAAKMSGQGYTFRLYAGHDGAGHVINPQGDRYRVNTQAGVCNCPFYRENWQFGTCKHLVWLKAEFDWQARADAEAADCAEWEEYGKHDLVASKS